VYVSPPLDVEIADLRAELARTSRHRPGHRRYLTDRIRVLEAARAAWPEKTTNASPGSGAPAGKDGRCRGVQSAGHPMRFGAERRWQFVATRGDQRGLETGRTTSRVA
jgi:hypothetical protein